MAAATERRVAFEGRPAMEVRFPLADGTHLQVFYVSAGTGIVAMAARTADASLETRFLGSLHFLK